MRRPPLMCSTIALIATLVIGLSASAVEPVETISTQSTGYNGDLAVAADGTVYVASISRASGAGGLEVATRTPGGVWSTALVDAFTTTGGEWASIAVDGSQNPVVLYAHSGSPYMFRRASFDGVSWTTADVIGNLASNKHCEIAVDASGNEHRAMLAGSLHFEYQGPVATGQILSPFAGNSLNGMDVDALGRPSLLYWRNTNGVWLRQWNGSGWTVQDISDESNWPESRERLDMACEPDGDVWVASIRNTNGATRVFAKFVDGTSVFEEEVSADVDPYGPDIGEALAIDVGPNGEPRIVFVTERCGQDCFGSAVRIATRSAGVWTTEVLDGPDDDRSPGQELCYEIGSDGTDHVVYREANTGKHVYVRRNASVTSTEYVPDAGLLRSVDVTPNPFNPQTTVYFELERSARVSIDVLDLRGRRIKTLASDWMAAGPNAVPWDGADRFGSTVASGSYVVRVQSEDGAVHNHKVQLVK